MVPFPPLCEVGLNHIHCYVFHCNQPVVSVLTPAGTNMDPCFEVSQVMQGSWYNQLTILSVYCLKLLKSKQSKTSPCSFMWLNHFYRNHKSRKSPKHQGWTVHVKLPLNFPGKPVLYWFMPFFLCLHLIAALFSFFPFRYPVHGLLPAQMGFTLCKNWLRLAPLNSTT